MKDEGATATSEEVGVETWEELESWEDLDCGDKEVDLNYSSR